MKLIVGSDHGGFKVKESLLETLRADGHTVIDVGTFDEESTDYPDYAALVGRAVAEGKAERGLLICGTGIGMCIAVNKIKGVRGAVVWSKKTAVLAAEHNRANVLCLGARVLSKAEITTFSRLWLKTRFSSGRHLRRVKKIAALERGGEQ
ncbi:MAG: ribose 5-phosphate isomerase B [Elusimicrobia bacterium]|nr:ribose 5-phosphate isomerase B [Elusimicrobiota bacterium]